MNIVSEKDFFINNFSYRKNILKWIDFEKNKKVLIMGSQCGVLTECFQNSKIYCIEENDGKNTTNMNKHKNIEIFNYSENEFIEKFHNKIDYIIFDGYLDNKLNKKNILEKCYSILNEDGQIVILANNKLGLRYFSGAKEGLKKEFGNLEDTTLYSKKEWEKLLNELNMKYQFFYPFPNYQFPEYIFKKSPKFNEIKPFISSYDDIRYSYFDEVSAFREVIKSGYFEDFNNAFIIVVNKLISDIEYVKFAGERKKQYQIYTAIKNDGNRKYVVKTPLFNEGEEHIRTINKYYKKYAHVNKNKLVKYCPVELVDNQLVFEFINGKSLESIVFEDVKKNDISNIRKKLDIINQIIDVDESVPFYVSDDFIKIFGDRDYKILEGLKSHSFNNIDLIFDNIIVNDYYNIIDYEWVFNCIIPETFILFRTIFHSTSLAELDKKILYNLYYDYGITEDMRKLFLEMEKQFQEYVSDYKIKDICDSFDCHILKIKEETKRKITNTIIQNNIAYDFPVIDANEVNITFNTDKQDVIFKVDRKAIIKIDKMTIDGNDALFTTNADIVINDNYYFLNAPVIKITNNVGKILEIHIIYYYYADDCINDIISLLKDNEKLNQRLVSLRKYKFVKLIEKIGG